MRKMKLTYLGVACLIIIGAASCSKKSYIIGGAPENTKAYANILTYDVLKNNPLFDTLVMLIDAAGLKDAVNQSNSTFFAPTDYTIYNYLNARTIADQNVNPSAKFGLDSLLYYIQNNINGTKDSLKMYLVGTPLPYSALTTTGAVYPTGLPGDSAVVSFEPTKAVWSGYNSAIVSSVPQVVYFTQLWQSFSPSSANPVEFITPDIGTRTLCITSGVQTQNGYLNTLSNSSVLFFYGEQQ